MWFLEVWGLFWAKTSNHLFPYLCKYVWFKDQVFRWWKEAIGKVSGEWESSAHCSAVLSLPDEGFTILTPRWGRELASSACSLPASHFVGLISTVSISLPNLCPPLFSYFVAHYWPELDQRWLANNTRATIVDHCWPLLTNVSRPVRREAANRVGSQCYGGGKPACSRIMTEGKVRPSCLLSHLRAGELFKLGNIVITRYNATVWVHYMCIIGACG